MYHDKNKIDLLDFKILLELVILGIYEAINQ